MGRPRESRVLLLTVRVHEKTASDDSGPISYYYYSLHSSKKCLLSPDITNQKAQAPLDNIYFLGQLGL